MCMCMYVYIYIVLCCVCVLPLTSVGKAGDFHTHDGPHDGIYRWRITHLHHFSAKHHVLILWMGKRNPAPPCMVESL